MTAVVRFLFLLSISVAIPCGRVSPPKLDREQAMAEVLSLPEVVDLGRRIGEASEGAVTLLGMEDGAWDRGTVTSYVREDPPDHTVRLATLRVSLFSGEIDIWDAGQDE